jgi:hypothetical protein
MHQFHSKPAEFRNSEAYFRMVVLATVLQQDCGIRYSPNRASPVGKGEADDKFYADSHYVFLHGLTGEMKSGTCCSLPVLYVAVGRRLKYPLSLAAAFRKYYGLAKFLKFDLFRTMHGGVSRYLKTRHMRDIFDYFIKYVGSSAYHSPASS